MGVAGFERSLSVLASSSMNLRNDLNGALTPGMAQVAVQIEQVDPPQTLKEDCGEIELHLDCKRSDSSSDDENNAHQRLGFLEELDNGNRENLDETGTNAKAGDQSQSMALSIPPPSRKDLQLYPTLPISGDCVLELGNKAPTRSDCLAMHGANSQQLHPIQPRGEEPICPPWLLMCSRYEALIADLSGEIKLQQTGISEYDEVKFIEPVRRPPSRDQVVSWLNTKRKRKSSSTFINNSS